MITPIIFKMEPEEEFLDKRDIVEEVQNELNVPTIYMFNSNENRFLDFKLGLEKFPNVKTVFIVTDSEEGFAEMASQLDVSLTCQLYRDYLDNFRINTGGV